MADPTWVAVGSAAAGAVLGGVAALTGSVIVNRRELVRSARLRIFDEVLPPLLDSRKDLPSPFAGHGNDEYEAGLKALWRAGVLAGRTERRLAQSALDEWGALGEVVRSSQFTDRHGNVALGGPGLERYKQGQVQLRGHLDALQSHVTRKLR